MTNQTSQSNLHTPAALIPALKDILRPLVKLLLSFRITFPEFAELLKNTYVEVAEKEFKLDNKRQTDARVSLLTGIHRKYIKGLRDDQGSLKESIDKGEAPEVILNGGRLVSHWTTKKKYQSHEGAPLSLPLKAQPGEPSFESLVQDVLKQDIRPKVILDEWLNLGVVSMSADMVITLNSEAFIPSKGLEEKVFFFGHNLSDHLAATTRNLLEREPPCFERCVYYDGLSGKSIDTIEKQARERGMEVLKELNELAMSLKLEDMAKKENKHRINIGLFVYHESEESKK